ncbi:MAG: alpha,alpha-trehalose-phosphate synthase (UDP-forming) [Acidobacteriota bacterium]
MRLSLRFLVPLMLALAAFAWVAVPLSDALMRRWAARDLDMRASDIATTVAEQLSGLIEAGSAPDIATLLNRMTRDDRLYAVGLCLDPGKDPVATPTFPRTIRCADLGRFGGEGAHVLASDRGTLHITVRDVGSAATPGPQLVLVQDMSVVDRRSEETRRYLFYYFIALGLAIALITVIIAQLSWRGWVAGMRALLRGEGILRPDSPRGAPELRPIAREMRELIRDLERQYRPLDGSQRIWDQAALRAALRSELHGNDVIALSNREPYIHNRTAAGIQMQRPASGLVTALEPVMRACSGTWIAHGSGSADREVVDRHDRIEVPPEHPFYKLRRVWLSKEEEAGYYAGFANEGLWPLCHIAHVRPTFRSSDWEYYRNVNAKFADAVVAEANSMDPIVLVQDYHYALVPRLIRNRLPDATIITFWHIPWPNPESFSICPWRAELLDGLLGSSILGFHTRFHVNNFLDTVDRVLEARVDRESMTISYQGKLTAVHVYPISIEWPPAALAGARSVADAGRLTRERLGLPAEQRLGIGIDRLDYTKGILERLNAVARLLELEPQWIGRFTFIQIAAPSRATIEDYRDYGDRVRALTAEINGRYPEAAHPPIVLITEHHEAAAVYEYYRAADVCFVSSLHDGMNLVAKEFVASRDDEQGVLVLSQFAGASRELPEALVVNPYDADQCAAALHMALTMSPNEQRERMRFMRGVVREFNVYRWAGRMLLDAAVMRQRGRFRASENPGNRA